jgi:Ala-tRNA(Pro) deacylase
METLLSRGRVQGSGLGVRLKTRSALEVDWHRRSRSAILTPTMADLTNVLDQAGVEYDLLPHPHTERAADEAQALGLPPSAVAKTLVLAAPGGYVRAVLPASERLDLRKVREHVEGGKSIHLASEDELARDYSDFELGAVPPFGGPSRDRVLVDVRLAEQHAVVLEAGSHEQSVRLETADLLKLTEAEVVDICKEE